MESTETRVMFNRRRWGGWAVFLGLLTILGVARAASAGSVEGATITIVVLGIPAAFGAKLALRRRPALVIDGEGLTEGRSGRRVLWDQIDMITVGAERGAFGTFHHLVVHLTQNGSPPQRRLIMTNATNPTEIDIGLDSLERPWSEVVELIEQHGGRRVIRRSGRSSGR